MQISLRRDELSCATRTALCRFTAQTAFTPSSSSRTTSEDTPRGVEVMGATVAVEQFPLWSQLHGILHIDPLIQQ